MFRHVASDVIHFDCLYEDDVGVKSLIIVVGVLSAVDVLCLLQSRVSNDHYTYRYISFISRSKQVKLFFSGEDLLLWELTEFIAQNIFSFEIDNRILMVETMMEVSGFNRIG